MGFGTSFFSFLFLQSFLFFCYFAEASSSFAYLGSGFVLFPLILEYGFLMGFQLWFLLSLWYLFFFASSLVLLALFLAFIYSSFVVSYVLYF